MLALHRPKPDFVKHLALPCLMAIAASTAPAQETKWSVGSNGNWNTETHWNNGLPDNSSDATIDIGGDYTVTIDSNAAVRNLLIDQASASIHHTSGTLQVSESIQIDLGIYHLDGGAIEGGELTSENFQISNGTLRNVHVIGDLVLNRPGSHLYLDGIPSLTPWDGPILDTTITGNLDVGANTQVTLTENLTQAEVLDGKQLIVRDGGQLNLGRTNIVGEGTFDNHGTVLVDGAITTENGAFFAEIETEGGFYNRATGNLVVTNWAELDIQNGLQNAGTVTVSEYGWLTLYDGWENTDEGSITVDKYSELHLGGTYDSMSLANITLERAAAGEVDDRYVPPGEPPMPVRGGTGHLFGDFINSDPDFRFSDGWVLSGATMQGGNLSSNTNLTLRYGTLSGVTVTDGLRLQSDPNAPADFSDISITGGTTIAGDIEIHQNSSLTIGQDFTLSSDQSLWLGAADDGNVSGVLHIAGNQTFTIDANATLSGNGDVWIGSDASLVFAGIVSPGDSTGQIRFAGNVEFKETAELVIEIGGSDDYDQLLFSNGTVLLDGRLRVQLLDGYLPEDGAEFDFFVGRYKGAFRDLVSHDIVADLGDQQLRINYHADRVSLYSTITTVPEPSTVALLGLASLGAAARWRRRQTMKAIK